MLAHEPSRTSTAHRRVTVGGGKFIWLQPSPCPGATKPLSGEGQEILVDRVAMASYAQKRDKRRLFTNVTAFLPPSGSMDNHARFFGSEEPTRDR